MSRGHGSLQRRILDELRRCGERGDSVPALTESLFGIDATESQKCSVRRAVRALDRDRVVEVARVVRPIYVRDVVWQPERAGPERGWAMDRTVGRKVDRGYVIRELPVNKVRLRPLSRPEESERLGVLT